MAHSLVKDFIVTVKKAIDYNITDTDLDNLILDFVNDRLKVLSGLLLDNGLVNEFEASTTFNTTTNQSWVELSTAVSDLDEIIKLSERTNDTPIDIISYKDFVDLYPDPTASYAATPKHAARFGTKIYFGPTPSGVLAIYIDYKKCVTNLTLTGTLPFSDKYDPLLKAMVKVDGVNWLDKNDSVAIASANKDMQYWTETLITDSAKNIGMNKQTESRRPSMFYGPRKNV